MTIIVRQLLKVIDIDIVPIAISYDPFINTVSVVPTRVKSEVEIVNV